MVEGLATGGGFNAKTLKKISKIATNWAQQNRRILLPSHLAEFINNELEDEYSLISNKLDMGSTTLLDNESENSIHNELDIFSSDCGCRD